MPVSQGIAAFGTYLKLGDGGSPENFAIIAEISDISGPGSKVNTAKLTNHSSPNAFEEIVPTTIDPGTFKITGNFTPLAVTQGYNTGLLRDFLNRNKRNFQLVWPNVSNTTMSFAAYVTDFDTKNPVSGSLEFTASVEITGMPVWTN
jgi:hypothetical protein